MRFILSITIVLISAIHLLAQDNDISYMVSGGKLNPLQANMDVQHYTLALDVDTEKKAINGYVEAELLLAKRSDTLLFDLYHNLKVSAISVNKKNNSFYQKDDYIFIVNAKGFLPGKQTIKIEYGGNPPIAVRPPWKGGFTWKKDKEGNPWVIINCQLQGAKVYFPCKDHPSDEPDNGADLFITVQKGLVVAGPGLLKGVTTKDNKDTYHWKTEYPISNYCILFNVAKYDVVKSTYTTVNGNVVPMEFYVLHEDVAKAKHLLELRARDTKVLEKYFGEYPWVKEKIGIAEVANPGMEHQTMITYGDPFNYLKVNGQDYSSNLFHEFAHEWWANKITNKDWAHMWIQESPATYAEALVFEDLQGRKGYDSVMLSFRKLIENKKPIVQGKEVNSADTYGRDVYFKGAFMLHTLRYMLGDDVFFPILKKLATDPRFTYHNFIDTDDFVKFFNTESKQNLTPLFDFYLKTTQVFEVNITQTGLEEYKLSVSNIPMTLPMEVTTDKGTERMLITKDPVIIKSKNWPVVDGKGYYLKKVVSL